MIRIKGHVFRCLIDIYVGDKEFDRFARAIKKNGCKVEMLRPEEDNYFGRTYGSFVWVRSTKKTAECIGQVSHEVSHLVDNIVQDRGLHGEEETRAYLTQYIMERIFS